MASLFKVTGVRKAIKQLKSRREIQGRRVSAGLKKGGLFLQRESQKIVPVQLGNLKNSAGTRSEGTGMETVVVIFYTAAYAVYVHENLNATHGNEFNMKHSLEIAKARGTPRGTPQGGMFMRGPNQQAKFLERPAREKRHQIARIVVDTAKRLL